MSVPRDEPGPAGPRAAGLASGLHAAVVAGLLALRSVRAWRLARFVEASAGTEVIASWHRDARTRVHVFDALHALGHSGVLILINGASAATAPFASLRPLEELAARGVLAAAARGR